MRVESLLKDIPSRNILVVGDVILDEYLWGDVRRISPEGPVPVVEIREQTYRPGGASNVAANIASLGGHVELIGVVGVDRQATILLELFLQNPRISPHFFSCHDRPTTTKTRILAHSQQMLRADREERHPIPQATEGDILASIQSHLESIHACVLSDYAKGVLTDTLLSSLIAMCKEANVPVIVDPKGHRYARYRGATVVTPNALEANLAAGNGDEAMPLEQVADRLHGEIGDGALLITRGEHGMALFQKNIPVVHIPAQARMIYDVTGAGDTVVAVLALLLSMGADMETAARMANYAAGIVVGKIGTACIELEELLAAL